MIGFLANNTYLDHTTCNLAGLELIKVYYHKNNWYALVTKLRSQVEGLYFDENDFDCYYIPHEGGFTSAHYIKYEARKTRSIDAKEYAKDLIHHINMENDHEDDFGFFTNTIKMADYKKQKSNEKSNT